MKKIIKGLVALEVVAVLGTYHVWHSMNTDQNYRKWMHTNYPSVLKGFYRSADLIGFPGVEEKDQEAWQKK